MLTVTVRIDQHWDSHSYLLKHVAAIGTSKNSIVAITREEMRVDICKPKA